MYILGISCFYHDSAAALICDGKIVACAQEERFTRIKHDASFPENAINFCLRCANISPFDIDYVVFYEKPFLKFERILLSMLGTYPLSYRSFQESMMVWLGDKLWIKNKIKEKLKLQDDKILFCEHHLSHCASSYFCSPYDNAAVLSVDGVGEWTTTAIGIASENKIKFMKEIKFPHSVGLLYSVFTAFLGFKINDGEYKVMGMAGYGKPRYVDKIYKLLKRFDDGSIFLDMKYFSYHFSSTTSFSKYFEYIFGSPRNPSQDKLDEYYADIAASIQYVTEEIMLGIANFLYKETNCKNLCISGGVALNCLANTKILKESNFENIYIFPSPGDSGGAVGCAMYVYYTLTNKKKNFVMEHTFYGEEFSRDEIKDFLEKRNVSYRFIDDEEDLLDVVCDYILDGKIIGWFQGRFEFGPRALGNRSILADPRKEEMKDIVNKKIKFREPFRPFAPAVLWDRVEEFFDIENVKLHYPSRFMLYAPVVKEDKAKVIPAVVHIDGTSRLQAVFYDTNPRFYKLIKKLEEKTGIGVILNTSFNLKDEPIVATPQDAFSTFKRSNIDILVMGNFIVERSSI